MQTSAEVKGFLQGALSEAEQPGERAFLLGGFLWGGWVLLFHLYSAVNEVRLDCHGYPLVENLIDDEDDFLQNIIDHIAIESLLRRIAQNFLNGIQDSTQKHLIFVLVCDHVYLQFIDNLEQHNKAPERKYFDLNQRVNYCLKASQHRALPFVWPYSAELFRRHVDAQFQTGRCHPSCTRTWRSASGSIWSRIECPGHSGGSPREPQQNYETCLPSNLRNISLNNHHSSSDDSYELLVYCFVFFIFFLIGGTGFLTTGSESDDSSEEVVDISLVFGLGVALTSSFLMAELNALSHQLSFQLNSFRCCCPKPSPSSLLFICTQSVIPDSFLPSPFPSLQPIFFMSLMPIQLSNFLLETPEPCSSLSLYLCAISTLQVNYYKVFQQRGDIAVVNKRLIRMNTSVYQSEVDVLFPNSNMNVFRLSSNFDFLAIVLNKCLTLFLFKKNLTLSITVDGDPVQIQFLNKSLMGIRFADKRLAFYRIVMTEFAIQLPKIEFTKITNCDLILLDPVDYQVLLLSESKLFIYSAADSAKLPQLVKSVSLVGVNISPNTECCLSKSDSTSPDSLYILNNDQVQRFLIRYEDDSAQEKGQIVHTNLKNLLSVFWSEKGYALLINNRLEVDLVCYAGSKGISTQIKDQIKPSKPLSRQCLHFESVDNVKDILCVYSEEQLAFNIFELSAINKEGDSLNFVHKLRIIHLKEKMVKYDIACDANQEVVLYVNELGLRNLKLKQKKVDKQLDPKNAEWKPKKIKQKQSKVLKHVTEPVIPPQPLSKSTEKLVREAQQATPSNVSVWVEKTEPKSVLLQPLKKNSEKKQVEKEKQKQKQKEKEKTKQKKAEFIQISDQKSIKETKKQLPKPVSAFDIAASKPVEQKVVPKPAQQKVQKTEIIPQKADVQTKLSQPLVEPKEAPKIQIKQQDTKPKEIISDIKRQDPKPPVEVIYQNYKQIQLSQEEADRQVEAYFTKFENLFSAQVSSFQNKMKGVITSQINKISQQISRTGSKLGQEVTNNVIKNTKQTLLKYIQQDLQGKIQIYFQEIFKKIGDTHQQGINYINQQIRIQKEKLDKMDSQGVLVNLQKIQGVLTKIKNQSQNGVIQHFQKSLISISEKMGELSQAIEKTLQKEVQFSEKEAAKGQQILEKLAQILKLVGKDEESKAIKKKKFLLIRRTP